jgi:hypothetical protein
MSGRIFYLILSLSIGRGPHPFRSRVPAYLCLRRRAHGAGGLSMTHRLLSKKRRQPAGDVVARERGGGVAAGANGEREREREGEGGRARLEGA